MDSVRTEAVRGGWFLHKACDAKQMLGGPIVAEITGLLCRCCVIVLFLCDEKRLKRFLRNQLAENKKMFYFMYTCITDVSRNSQYILK